MTDEPVFNPLEKTNLGKSVVDALLDRPELPLTQISRFSGAGIYAIYYHGDFPHYAPLSERYHAGLPIPIYTGKGVPKGSRKGSNLSPASQTNPLSGRLNEHKESIEQTANLDVSHFTYRYLLVDDIWIPLGESLVIQKFRPLWNVVVEGFGNHDPGRGRYGGMRPLWDELHPGRPWALRCMPPRLSASALLQLVASHMSNLGPAHH
jgi:hypothetical protein